MPKGDLPPAQASRVVAAMRTLRAERYGTNAALARAIGRSGAAVGSMLAAAPKSAPSYETAQRVAVLLGVTTEGLLNGTGEPAARAIADDPYPERAEALERLRGLLTAQVEMEIKLLFLDPAKGPRSILWWIKTAARMGEDAAEDAEVRKSVK